MRTKYIIEIPDDKIGDFIGSTHFLMPYMMAGHMGHLDTGLPIAPYREPDMEQVRKEAYRNGYETAKHECEDCQKSVDVEAIRKEAYEQGKMDAYVEDSKNITMLKAEADEAYQKGLNDAWKAARKICTNWVLPDSVFSEIFGMDKTIDDIMKENTASEAIEKIRQYEQEQEGIKIGDEVAFHHDDGRPDTVVVVTYIGQDGFIDGMDGRGTQYAHKNPKKWAKTGRHFPEIAEVLKKMREE